MVIRQFTLAGPVISLLLVAMPLYGQLAAAGGIIESGKSLTELQQELAKSKAALEARKRDNLELAEQRKELETEVVRLQKLLSKQEQSVEVVPQSGLPNGEQNKLVTQ